MLIDAQGEVVQQNDFYPFGAKALKGGYADNDNRFLFSGKEQQNMLDVNTYDFGARMYDAAIARWTCVDPMGEEYTNFSPYNYCVNNPMAFVDPNGEDWVEINRTYFYDPLVSNQDDVTKKYIDGLKYLNSRNQNE